MFAHSGHTITMGKRRPQAKRAARRVTDTNENEGSATAVERFALQGTAAGIADQGAGSR
jgi:hydroxymethylpyrimidine pyrophosphatase-like HAD family hydrolase